MSEANRPEHAVTYSFVINLDKDGISITITGESIDFVKHNPEAKIRHRHNRLAAELGNHMRDFIRGN